MRLMGFMKTAVAILGVVIIALLVLVFDLPVLSAGAVRASVQSCSSATPVAARPTLRHGDTGICVTLVQRMLLDRGYNLGVTAPTGNYLSATKAAIERFQRRHQLTVTGMTDGATWRKLGGNKAVSESTSKYDIARGPNRTKNVVLTYDDCPKSLGAMKAMVLAAKRANIGLVLAPTGACIRSGRFDVAFARTNGQYVINHSNTHANLTRLSHAQILRELSTPGVVTNYGRPPYGAVNGTVMKAYAAKNIRVWNWTVDTNDWRGKSQAEIVRYVIVNARSSGVVLMHMQHRGFNPSAMQQIQQGLRGRGLGVCRVYPGVTPEMLPSALPC